MRPNVTPHFLYDGYNPMKSASSKAGAGCLILFALPFAAVGTFTLIGAVRSFLAGAEPQQTFFLACFGIAFGLAGFGLIFAALWGSKKAERDEALRARHPGEPWLHNEEWKSRRIGDDSRGGMIALWLFGILWNAIASPVLLFFPREWEKGNYAILIGLIFPLIGVCLIVAAVRATLRALRFHRSTFVLDTLPAPVGGMLRGRVEVPYAPLAQADSIVVRLSAVRRRRSGKSTTDSILWQNDEELARGAIARMPDRVSIPVAIAIPAGLPQSDDDGDEKMIWRLSVDAEVPGVDYHASFVVPVFDTGVAASPHPPVPHTPPPEPREPESFVAKTAANGRELAFPPFRARALAVTTFVIAAVWVAAVTLLFLAAEVPGWVAVVFGLFAVPIALMSLDLFFGSSTILLGGGQVVLRRRFFGVREHVLRRGDIAAAEARISTQTGNRPYYDVEVRTREGKKLTAAKYIRSKREAEWVAAQIRGAVDSRT